MVYRNIIPGAALTFLFALGIPHTAFAEHDERGTVSSEAEDCIEVNHHDDHGRDHRHDAGEWDNSHQHDGREESFAILDAAHANERGDDDSEGEDEDGHGEDDCAVLPPAEVPEAPQAVLLSASAVLTGGASLVILRRRSGTLRTSRV